MEEVTAAVQLPTLPENRTTLGATMELTRGGSGSSYKAAIIKTKQLATTTATAKEERQGSDHGMDLPKTN